MFSRISGVIFNLSINNAPFERLFHSDKNIVVSIFILILSCICGSIYPFLQYDSNLEFIVSEFIIKFIGLLSQNLFIISGLYFLGITFFANSARAGISSAGISSKNPTKIDKKKYTNIQKTFEFISIYSNPSLNWNDFGSTNNKRNKNFARYHHIYLHTMALYINN